MCVFFTDQLYHGMRFSPFWNTIWELFTRHRTCKFGIFPLNHHFGTPFGSEYFWFTFSFCIEVASQILFATLFCLRKTRWWFQRFFIFIIFHPYLGKIPILTSIGLVQPPTKKPVCPEISIRIFVVATT